MKRFPFFSPFSLSPFLLFMQRNEKIRFTIIRMEQFFFFFLVRIRGVERKSGWPTGGKDEALFEAGPPFKKGLNEGTFG